MLLSSAEIINMVESKGVVRANHPMKPGKDGIYYFEVKIENRGDDSKHQISDYFGVGFCEENTPLNIQLGWREGSWGYHGDDGNSFDAGLRTVTGDPYGPKYSQDHTIGCGVNFDKNTAFYTMDGEIIGKLLFATVRKSRFLISFLMFSLLWLAGDEC